MKTFKVARIKKDLTQKQLSEALGMSVGTINQIETGIKSIESMRVRDLRKLCSALDLDISDVLKITNNKK